MMAAIHLGVSVPEPSLLLTPPRLFFFELVTMVCFYPHSLTYSGTHSFIPPVFLNSVVKWSSKDLDYRSLFQGGHFDTVGKTQV